MSRRRRAAYGVGIIVAIFLFVQLGALALVGPFESAGYQPTPDPQDPTNTFVYVGAILVATALMLLAFRLGVDRLIRVLIVVSGAWLSLYLFRVLFDFALPTSVANLVAFVVAAALGVAMYVHPEWYVIDAAGAVMGAAAAGLFGIGFGVLPAIILLTVLAVYDAISVYGTEHMLTLAEGVLDLKVPVVLVIPFSRSYSFIDAEAPDARAHGRGDDGGSSGGDSRAADASGDGGGDVEPGEQRERADEDGGEDPLDREAMFIGLGDAVIPTVLVASVAFFVPDAVDAAFGVPVPALTAMVGTFAGLAILLWMVMKGRAHAGLPLLNGGAITGYLVGALASGLTLTQALGLTPYL